MTWPLFIGAAILLLGSPILYYWPEWRASATYSTTKPYDPEKYDPNTLYVIVYHGWFSKDVWVRNIDRETTAEERTKKKKELIELFKKGEIPSDNHTKKDFE